MDDDMYFDNIVVTGDPAVAKEYRGKWKERNALEVCGALFNANTATITLRVLWSILLNKSLIWH